MVGRLRYTSASYYLLIWLASLCLLSSDSKATARAAENSGLKLVTVNFAPYGRVRPGRVLVIRARVSNDSDSPSEGLLVVRIEKLDDEEGARMVKLAPHETKIFDLYLHVPRSVKAGDYVIITASLTAKDGSRQVMLEGDNSSMFQTLRLQVEPEKVVTAVLLDSAPPEYPDWDWRRPSVYDSYEMVVAARLDAEFSRRCVVMDAELVPCQLADWDSIDCLVISDDTRLGDAATVESIRLWLQSGGRVWIMLDRVRCESIRGLLAQGQLCEEVGSVELAEFSVQSDTLDSLSEEEQSVVLRDPVKFTRVLQQGGEVSHTVNGWPAAMWMRVGHGHLLLTTLGPRAWLMPRNAPPSKKGPSYEGPYRLARWAGNFAARFHEPKSILPLDDKTVEYPLRHIGNPVLAKPIVAAVLLAFCALLVAVGFWRFASGSLNNIGWLAPLLAIVGATPLLLAAAWVRKDIPECVSALQIVQSLPNGESLLVREKAAVYLNSPVSTQLLPEFDAKPELAAQMASSGMRRWIWSDFQQWQLSNTAWPAGVWRFEQTYTLPAQAMLAIGTIGSEGVSFALPVGLPSVLEDPVLSFAPNDPAVCESRADGQLLAGISESIVGDKWIRGTLMSDEQARRIDVYQQMFTVEGHQSNWAYPVLHGWTQTWPGGPQWQRELVQHGSALVALPVKLLPVPAGQSVLVPHSLIRISKLRNNASYSPTFSNVTGKWNDPSTIPTNVGLRYRLPSEVVPIQADAIEVQFQLRAPQRRVTLSSLAQDPATQIAIWEGPSGNYTHTITDPQILADAQDGLIDLRLEVSQRVGAGAGANAPSNLSTWQVDHLRLSVRGVTQERITVGHP